MARMIPVYSTSEESKAETEIFKALQDRCPDSWLALHSVDVGVKGKGLFGEADFVVIIPDCAIVCVETKTYARLTDGQWHYRHGSKGSDRSPLTQAKNASVGISQFLNRFGYGDLCVTPMAILPMSELPDHVIDPDDRKLLVSKREYKTLGLERSLRRAAAEWQRRHPKKRPVRSCELDRIVELMRSPIECFISPCQRIAGAFDEAKNFTKEQFHLLDQLADNKRLLIDGLAGTGKTMMAIEEARRASEAGKTVYLMCFNRLLGQWLHEQMGADKGGCRVMTADQFAWAALGEKGDPPWDCKDGEFWENLPRRAAERIREGTSPLPRADVLILDEAQDLLVRANHLDMLDAILVHGLSRGQWRLFGDFCNQAIFWTGPPPVTFLCQWLGYDVARVSLRENCRNTPRVSNFAAMAGALGDGSYRCIRRADDHLDPAVRFYSDSADQAAMLFDLLEEFLGNGVHAEDIVILSRRSDEKSLAGKICRELSQSVVTKLGSMLVPLVGGGKMTNRIRFTSIQRYKGCEAGVIIVTDIDDPSVPWEGVDNPEGELRRLLYIAATRTLSRLAVLAHIQWSVPFKQP